MRGRPRKPTNAVQPISPGRPAMPTKLPAAGRRLWDEVCSLLPEDVLSLLDRSMLEGMCRWYARFRANVDKDDYKSQCLAGMAWKHYATAAKSFGLSPADRSKLHGKKPEPEAKEDILKYVG